MMAAPIPVREPYQGLLQILRYNRPFYVQTVSGILAAVLLSLWLPGVVRSIVLLLAALAAFWTASSLLVSHYIYDRSGFYSLSWLPACLSRIPQRWLSIDAGIDETSQVIAALFPESVGHMTDVYDPQEMTEPSIKRARRLAAVPDVAAANWRVLPKPDREFDSAFLIFAAHELRHPQARVQLLREVSRVLHVGGELVLVEHLRDFANFFAFGPGFLHFFSARTWRTAAHSAGLTVRLHRRVTPFVHVFTLRNE